MTCSRLSRLSAVLTGWLLPALVPAVLMGLWAVASPAAAADGDSHLEMTMVLHDDETVDLRLLLMVEGMTRSDLKDSDNGCTASGFEEVADASSEATFEISEMEGEPACAIEAPGMSLTGVESLFDDQLSVTHSDGTYEVVLDEDFFGSIAEPHVALEFPGRVESASAGGSIDGKTVVWDRPSSSGELRAVGADASGPSSFLILLGVLVALIVVAGLVSLVLVRRRQAVAPGQVPLPGYAPPAVPGAVPTVGQPGYVAQPQDSPYASGQPGQAPPTAPYVLGQEGALGPGYGPGGLQQPPTPPSAPSGQGPVQGGYPAQWRGPQQ